MYKKWNRKVAQIEKCFLCGLLYLSGGFLMVCLLLMISAWGVILFFEKMIYAIDGLFTYKITNRGW